MVFLRLRRTLMNKKTFKKDFMINLYKAHKSNRLVRDLLPGSNSFCEYCGGVALTFKHLLQESHITNVGINSEVIFYRNFILVSNGT